MQPKWEFPPRERLGRSGPLRNSSLAALLHLAVLGVGQKDLILGVSDVSLGLVQMPR